MDTLAESVRSAETHPGPATHSGKMSDEAENTKTQPPFARADALPTTSTIEVKDQPLVSIIIPTKNRCELLRETLASVQAQTYQNWECIVVDDGSSDDTGLILTSMAAHEPRIKHFRQSKELAGAPAARNRGLVASKGEYVLFFDDDDLMTPNLLGGRLAAFERLTSYDAVVTEGFYLSEDLNAGPIKRIQYGDLALFRTAIPVPWSTPSYLWKRTSLKRIGLWDEALLNLQDFEYYTRGRILGLRYAFLRYPDWFYRVGHSSGQLTVKSGARSDVEVFARNARMLRSNENITKFQRFVWYVFVLRHAVNAFRSHPESKEHALWSRNIWLEFCSGMAANACIMTLGDWVIKTNRIRLVGGLFRHVLFTISHIPTAV